MMQPANKIKRGTPFIDTVKGINIWVWHDKQDGEVLVYDSPKFNGESYLAKISDLMPIHKQRSSSIKSKPKVLSSSEKQSKDIRNDFFTEVAIDMPFNCMNCDKPLYAFTSWSKRCVSAHCLPKSIFPEISENKDNIVFMGVDLIAGVCNCHTEFDANVDNRTSMHIYPLILKRFNEKLKPLLSSDKIIMAWKYLGIKYTSEMLKELK